MELKKISLITLVTGAILVTLTSFSDRAQASTFYTIQISSPQKEKQAHELVTKLKADGIASFEARVVIKGQKHFRVCSGYFENPKKAAEARSDIVRRTHRKNVFVQKLKGSALPDRMVLGDFD